MNTQSHVLLGAALFSRRGLPARSMAAALGGLLPDVPLYLFFVGARMTGHSDGAIFGDLYWRDPMPTIMGASHSFVLWGALCLAGLALWRRAPAKKVDLLDGNRVGRAGWGEIMTVLSAAALVHAATDFLLHHGDAHMQFWPVSRWTFASPVSYWNPAHYGNEWSLAEAVLGIVCAVVLWRRFPRLWVRALCALALAMYAAVPFYFIHAIV